MWRRPKKRVERQKRKVWPPPGDTVEWRPNLKLDSIESYRKYHESGRYHWWNENKRPKFIRR